MTVDELLATEHVLSGWPPPTEIKRRAAANRQLRMRCPEGFGTYSQRNEGRTRVRWLQAVRIRLKNRDGMRCALCGVEPTERELSVWRGPDARWPSWLEVDHVVPLALGGNHHAENMRLLCAKCNRTEWAATKGAQAEPDDGYHPA